MRFDYENMWSGQGPATAGGAVQGQAITASAASTNIIDHGAAGPGPRVMDGRAYVQVVTEDFATLTSLQAELQSDNDVAFGSPTTLVIGPDLALAALVTGAVLLDVGGIRLTERYTRINYTVTGSDATAGEVIAGIVHDVQDGYGQR